ncbi:hypothetical protein CC78DRAFT_545447 [Lojkania enalia]|uniref:Uncharacterized protein n=1 Tax=Lojkania enalia TaxID=147567 RepID=A0A9P4N7S4_9PLEO|nr:hypothetical protein CC78DRAFT_545447 [Didymosphaeria enalia]
MSQYPLSKLAGLVVEAVGRNVVSWVPSIPSPRPMVIGTSPHDSNTDKVVDNDDNQRWVREVLNRRARGPREELVVAVYRALPEFAQHRKYRAEVVFKLISELRKMSNLKRGVNSQEFLERVRRFLKDESGKAWVNAWLQPDTSEIDSIISSPMLFPNADSDRQHVTVTMSEPTSRPPDTTAHGEAKSTLQPGGLSVPTSPAMSKPTAVQLRPGPNGFSLQHRSLGRGADRNKAILPPLDWMWSGRTPFTTNPFEPESSTPRLDPGTTVLKPHRRRFSDSHLSVCPKCLTTHGAPLMLDPTTTMNAQFEVIRVARYERGQKTVVINELMLFLRIMLILSIVMLFVRYSDGKLT